MTHKKKKKKKKKKLFFPVRITRGGPARHIMINSWHPFENLPKNKIFYIKHKITPPPHPQHPSAQPAALASQPHCPISPNAVKP